MILATSRAPTPDAFFDGWCFVGADYVAGRQGYADYAATTGRNLPPGCDGCYVVGAETMDGFLIGTDARGLYKLFLYSQDDFWALGTSLAELADFVRERGLPLDPVREEVMLFGVRTSFSSQMTSSRSIFRQIQLLPAGVSALIRGGQVAMDGPYPSAELAYEVALSKYIHIWRDRLSTLLDDPRISIPSDLSGGLDSRVVAAFLIESGRVDSSERRFRIASQPRRQDDFTAASLIAAEYGLTLNGPALKRDAFRSGARALSRWREQALGVYLPVYLNPRPFDPFHFQAHGAGGENHRHYYQDPSLETRLLRYRREIGNGMDEWLTRVQKSLEPALEAAPHVSPLVMHYRQYRNRFHFGHRPHARPMFTPLNSVLLDQVTDRPGGVETRQVYFDIMESLAKGLAGLPYDEAAKSPTKDNYAALTIVSSLRLPQPGRVYASPVDPGSATDTIDEYRSWLEMAGRALSNQAVQDIIGGEATKRAKSTLTEADKTERQLSSHHRGILDLSHSLIADFALG